MKNFFIKFFLLFSTLLSLTFATESKNQTLRIGTILPLTGSYQEIGSKILKTFELAIFELPNINITLLPFDNKSTVNGTKFAFQELQTQNIDIVLGPLFKENLQSISNEKNFSKYIFITLSNNNIYLPPNTISFGINLESQIKSLRKIIEEKNKSTFFFGKANNFSLDVIKEIEKQKINLKKKFQYSSFNDMNEQARVATSYNWRHQKLLKEVKKLQNSTDTKDIEKLKLLEQLDTIGGVNYQQVIIPTFDNDLISAVSFFDYYDVNYNNVQFITLNQWFNKKILIEPSLQNIIFPSVHYKNFQELDKKLQDNYNTKISNIEILAYDIIPLLAATWHEKKDNTFAMKDFINKEFKGKSGVFKINTSNFVERKLDLYQIKNNQFTKIN
jgi:branched-chain amino acid transport system substrate-binding protein